MFYSKPRRKQEINGVGLRIFSCPFPPFQCFSFLLTSPISFSFVFLIPHFICLIPLLPPPQFISCFSIMAEIRSFLSFVFFPSIFVLLVFYLFSIIHDGTSNIFPSQVFSSRVMPPLTNDPMSFNFASHILSAKTSN